MSWHLKVRVANTESSVNTYSKYYISAITAIPLTKTKCYFQSTTKYRSVIKASLLPAPVFGRYISSQYAKRSMTQKLELTDMYTETGADPMSQVRGTFSFSSSFIDVQVDPYIHAESSSTHTNSSTERDRYLHLVGL